MNQKKKINVKAAIKRPGALTKAVGGKPSKKIQAVRKLAKTGTKQQQEEANFYLNVLDPARRPKKG